MYVFFLLCFIFIFILKRERTWSCVARDVKEELGGAGGGGSKIKKYVV